MFSSLVILNNLFKISIFILAEFSGRNLSLFISKEAIIIRLIVSKQIFSIFTYIPSRSRLEILKENK